LRTAQTFLLNGDPTELKRTSARLSGQGRYVTFNFSKRPKGVPPPASYFEFPEMENHPLTCLDYRLAQVK